MGHIDRARSLPRFIRLMKPTHVRKRGTADDFEYHRFLGTSHFCKNICLNISDFGRSPRYAAKVEQAFLTDHTEQIERIKVKLRAARKADPHRKVFGASSHRYKLKTPLRHHDLQTFERRYSITLPSCYRAFATEIGNGGPSFRGPSCWPSTASTHLASVSMSYSKTQRILLRSQRLSNLQ